MVRQTQKAQKVQGSPEAREPQKSRTSTAGMENGGGTNGFANGEALAAMIKANEAMLAGYVAMQQEIAEFSNGRLRQDMENQEALTQCGDLQEAFRLQAEFAQKAMQQYAQETAKLIELSARIGRECWGPFEDATRATWQSMTPR